MWSEITIEDGDGALCLTADGKSLLPINRWPQCYWCNSTAMYMVTRTGGMDDTPRTYTDRACERHALGWISPKTRLLVRDPAPFQKRVANMTTQPENPDAYMVRCSECDVIVDNRVHQCGRSDRDLPTV